MSFFEFYTLEESKFRETPQELIQQIKKIAEIYFNQYSSNNKDSVKKLKKEGKIVTLHTHMFFKHYFDDFSEEKNYPTFFTPKMTYVTITDLATNTKKKIRFLCLYGNDIGTNYATYSDKHDTVHLYDDNLKDLPQQRIESIILHELTHAFQEYKTTSDEYNQMINRKKFIAPVYYQEPVEFDSHLNEIVYLTTQKFKMLKEGIKKAKEPATKHILERRLETFLTELRLIIKNPPETYFKYKELDLPTHLLDFDLFLKTLSKNLELWKKFKLKMTNLYEDLTKKTALEVD